MDGLGVSLSDKAYNDIFSANFINQGAPVPQRQAILAICLLIQLYYDETIFRPSAADPAQA